MAVIKVKVASIIGRAEELDRVTEICGRSGVFHPDHALDFYEHADQFSQLSEENPYSGYLQKLFDSLIVLGHTPELLPEDKIQQLTVTQQEAEAYVSAFAKKVDQLQNELTSVQKEKDACTQEAELVKHFVGLNLDLAALGNCKFVKLRFGSIPKASELILAEKYGAYPYLKFFPCTRDPLNTWGIYLCPLDHAQEVDGIFSSLYFQRVRLQSISGTPEELVKSLQNRFVELNGKLVVLRRNGEDLWATEQKRFTEVYSYLAERDTYFRVRRYAAVYHDNFILTGWIPEECESTFTAALEPLKSVECNLEDADNVLSHSPPVKLKNKFLAKPYEFFINMYGLPNYHEVDPTPLVAIIFTLLFGIMFGDVGQGLCLAFFGFFYMWKKRGMPIGKILLPCGIMATLFGFVFGSWFGNEHFLDPLYHSMGLAGKPVSVMEGDTTVKIIIISVAIGFVCMCIAMLMNIYSSIKQKDYARAVVSSNGVIALVFYIALVVGLVVQMVTGTKVMTPVYLAVFIILPLVLLFMQEPLACKIRNEKFVPESGWGMFFTQSFFEWFEMLLSLLSNTISFLRIGAFVLVHAGMMTMVLTLSQMIDPSFGFGWYANMAVGNIFVGVLEALLVSIHVLRLNFYEMFSRFYSGDGRAFTPIRVKGLIKA